MLKGLRAILNAEEVRGPLFRLTLFYVIFGGVSLVVVGHAMDISADAAVEAFVIWCFAAIFLSGTAVFCFRMAARLADSGLHVLHLAYAFCWSLTFIFGTHVLRAGLMLFLNMVLDSSPFDDSNPLEAVCAMLALSERATFMVGMIFMFPLCVLVGPLPRRSIEYLYRGPRARLIARNFLFIRICVLLLILAVTWNSLRVQYSIFRGAEGIWAAYDSKQAHYELFVQHLWLCLAFECVLVAFVAPWLASRQVRKLRGTESRGDTTPAPVYTKDK